MVGDGRKKSVGGESRKFGKDLRIDSDPV